MKILKKEKEVLRKEKEVKLREMVEMARERERRMGMAKPTVLEMVCDRARKSAEVWRVGDPGVVV
jgi:hypothetical protein